MMHFSNAIVSPLSSSSRFADSNFAYAVNDANLALLRELREAARQPADDLFFQSRSFAASIFGGPNTTP